MNKLKRIYATTRKRYTAQELRNIGFRIEGSVLVKRGACRIILAEATGLSDSYRVTPYVRHWR